MVEGWIVAIIATLIHVTGWFLFAVFMRRTNETAETWTIVAIGAIWPAVLMVLVLLMPFLIMIKLVDTAKEPEK